MSFWVYVAIQLISAALIYELTPTPKGPGARRGNAPTTAQGVKIRVIFGDVWIPDSQVTYWGGQRQVPIKASSK